MKDEKEESDNNEKRSNNVIPIAIVTRYPLIAEALDRLLKEINATYSLVATKAEGGLSSAISLARRNQPRVMILHDPDLDKDIFDVVHHINIISKKTKLLLLFQPVSDSVTLRLLTAGIHGILPPEADSQQLNKAITDLTKERRYLPERVQALCAERFLTAEADKTPGDQLSDREFQVMRLLALGSANREIAETLSVSVKTIDTHRSNILKKLNLRNNSDITRFAIKNKYIDV